MSTGVYPALCQILKPFWGNNESLSSLFSFLALRNVQNIPDSPFYKTVQLFKTFISPVYSKMPKKTHLVQNSIVSTHKSYNLLHRNMSVRTLLQFFLAAYILLVLWVREKVLICDQDICLVSIMLCNKPQTKAKSLVQPTMSHYFLKKFSLKYFFQVQHRNTQSNPNRIQHLIIILL